MNLTKDYEDFVERNPEYARNIVNHTFDEKSGSIHLILNDGKDAWYYPVNAIPKSRKK